MPETALPSDAAWDDLTFSEQFLLWAIRMWAQLSDDPERASDFIAPAFDRVGAEGAGPLFHSFMCGVTAGASRRIEVRCPRSQEICGDEFGLMRALHACQRDHGGAARTLLAGFVHSGALRHVQMHASLLMRICASNGILIRPLEGGPSAVQGEPLHAELPTGVTIH